ncbi:hypothetical protein SCB49_08498 [unidentified eubacterium SCB49]|nr:hypothetical protein SCB49_08498 [unidentified eubacterium SCB49]
MSNISLIIQQFSEEDEQEFTRYLKQKNRRGDTKNLQLYKLLRTNNTEKIDEKIYGKPARNAYHALHKRLQDAVIDFVASQSFKGETSEELDTLRLLLAARIFFEQRHYKIAIKTLAKAEQKALQFEIYAILTEIYHTKIQYAHLQTNTSLESIIAAAEQNLKYFNQEQHLAMAYATIKARLADNPKVSAKRVIIEVLATYNISPNTGFTFKSLFQLMNVLVTAAEMHRNYFEIASYMHELYTIVSEKEALAEKHLYYHILILHLMAVSYFRNKDFTASLSFTAKMKLQMEKQKRKYQRLFEDKWMELQAINLNYSGAATEAIALLQNHKHNSLDGQITLIMCYFQQSQFSDAYHIFKQLNHSDQWYEKKMGWIWVVKKAIIEILILVELDKLDLVWSRLESFKKRFGSKLKKAGENRALTFINMVQQYYDNPSQVTSQDFENKVETSFKWIGTAREDIFVMSFYAWLKAKMTQQNLYNVTLELVSR